MKSKKLYFIFFIVILFVNIFFCNNSYGINFNVESPSAILFNRDTGKILYEKNAYDRKYPASTTKIMTAILTIENCSLDDTAVVSTNATKLPYDYISADLQPDEILTINDLLHLLLLPSSNDAAIVLAEHIAGSIDEFSNMMNNKAKEIGCLDTHFVNPNGIHDDNHYSTAYDLCLMANYAMNNDTFRQIVSTINYTVPATNKYQERSLINTNLLLHEFYEKDNAENIYYCEYATGIKTGYTTSAKNCLVASAKKDNMEFISVVLDSALHETRNNSQRFADSKNLLETALTNYSLSTIKKSNDVITTVQVPNVSFLGKNLDLVLENDIEILLKNNDLNLEITPEIKLYEEKIQAPISKGDIIGTATYVYDGTSCTQNIIAANFVPTDEQVINCLQIIGIIIIAFIVIYIIKRIKRA